jgi:hypothetical protein
LVSNFTNVTNTQFDEMEVSVVWGDLLQTEAFDRSPLDIPCGNTNACFYRTTCDSGEGPLSAFIGVVRRILGFFKLFILGGCEPCPEI